MYSILILYLVILNELGNKRSLVNIFHFCMMVEYFYSSWQKIFLKNISDYHIIHIGSNPLFHKRAVEMHSKT